MSFPNIPNISFIHIVNIRIAEHWESMAHCQGFPPIALHPTTNSPYLCFTFWRVQKIIREYRKFQLWALGLLDPDSFQTWRPHPELMREISAVSASSLDDFGGFTSTIIVSLLEWIIPHIIKYVQIINRLSIYKPYIPSGNLLRSYRKSPFEMGNITINHDFQQLY